MKIVLFGASGPTGQLMISEAIRRNHSVVALARNPEKINLSHPNLRMVQGDVMNFADVDKIVNGMDVVISALGVSAQIKDKDLPPTRSNGTANLIKAMNKHGVKRIICITSQGAGDTKHSAGLIMRFLVAFMWKNRFKDVNKQEKLLFESHLDYTIVRPPALTNQPGTGKIFAGSYSTFLGSSISRGDLAKFIVDETENNHWIQKALSV